MEDVAFKTNIECLADLVAEKYGSNAVLWIYRKYDASNLDELSTSYYSDVFSELFQMENDV